MMIKKILILFSNIKIIFLIVIILLFSLTSCLNYTISGALIGGGSGLGVGTTLGYLMGEDYCQGCGGLSSLSDETFSTVTGGIIGLILFATTGAIVGNYYENIKLEKDLLNNMELKKKSGIGYESQYQFFAACRLGDEKFITKTLNSNLGYIDLEDEYEKTGLHWAVELGHEIITKQLVNEGVNIDLQDFSGKTALHYAMINKNVEIGEFLIDEGANLNIVDLDNKSPLDYLNVNNYTNKFLFDLLIEDRKILASIYNKNDKLEIQQIDIFK